MTSKKKLEELIVYIAGKSYGDKHFGAVKLNKILLNADQYYFAKTGASISGQTYNKHPLGPVPVDVFDAMAVLKASNSVAVRELPAGTSSVRKAVFATRDADLSMFDVEEIAFLDSIIDELKDVTSMTLSNESHGAAWENANMREVLPLGSIFFPLKHELTDEDKSRGYELLKQHSWGKTYGWSVS